MEKLQPLGGKIWTKPFKVLTILAVIGGIFILKRFFFGIGSVTNLSDGYPWGLWIVFDVVTSTALACGGYAMAMLVYIFNKQEYHPLVRSALVASIFGYSLAGLAIVIDTGRYWQLYNIFIPPYLNVNSVMFEVASCIALYVLIMWIELSPAWFEQKYGKVPGWLNKIMFFVIAIGVLLPTMHQASLGGLMIAMGEKLSPLWQTQFIPALFLITAITLGYAMVVFESIFSANQFNRPVEMKMLTKLSRFIPFLTIAFLVLRFGVIAFNGDLGLIFRFDLSALMFIIETILFIVPVVILWKPENRTKINNLFRAAVFFIIAGVLYRFDTFIIVFNPGHGYRYFPAFQEIMITVGVVALEIMLYMIFVKRLPIYPQVKHA